LFVSINTPLNVVTIDWDKRNWKRVPTPYEEREIATKMLRLNGGPDYSPATESLSAAHKAIRFKQTEGCFFCSDGRENAEKALRLNAVWNVPF
jgi:hypothetical protein